MTKSQQRSAILLMHCPDRPGLVAAVAEFIHCGGGNIIHLDQHVDQEKRVFFMRVEWELERFAVKAEKIGDVFRDKIGTRFQMQWRLHFSDETPRMAIFVSHLSHCLYDVLARCQSREWNVNVPLIISNHTELESVARTFGIDYQVFPVTAKNKAAQEKRQLELLAQHNVDFIVLARYMQVLTPTFIKKFPERIINIHHSFLPAFPGAKPYHSAHARGVKIIGATSHYVTTDLDAGPIIEQDVTHVSHKDTVGDLIRKGRDLEKIVLARAIWWHLNRKVLVYDNKTVTFH